MMSSYKEGQEGQDCQEGQGGTASVGADAFLWVGNHPALDFLNTCPRRDGQPDERLLGDRDVVAWLAASGLVETSDLAAAGMSASPPKQLASRARTLREALRATVDVVRAAKRVGPAHLEPLNHVLRRDRPFRQLSCDGGRIQARPRRSFETVDDLLAPIAGAAAALLTEADLGRVRACGNHECVLLFHDTSKNGSRRWCSMQTCGNRHKVAKHRRGRN